MRQPDPVLPATNVSYRVVQIARIIRGENSHGWASMLPRRTLLVLLSSALTGSFFVARARTPDRIARVGFLPASTDSPGLRELRDGLQDLGYVVGQNLLLEARDGGPNNEHLQERAAELLALHVDIIVTQGPYGLVAAKKATTSVPIVFAGIGANFPALTDGGNLTGVAEEIVDSTVMRLVLLKEAVPSLARIGILANPGNYGTKSYLQACQIWAQKFGVDLTVYDVKSPEDVSPAFDRMARDQMQGVLAFTDSIIFRQRDLIVKIALEKNLPGVYPYREWVEAGGLLAYGPDLSHTLRQQVPAIVDKILKGSKPTDIAVEQPKSFFFINLSTAKAMGITLPKSVLDRNPKFV